MPSKPLRQALSRRMLRTPAGGTPDAFERARWFAAAGRFARFDFDRHEGYLLLRAKAGEFVLVLNLGAVNQAVDRVLAVRRVQRPRREEPPCGRRLSRSPR